MTRALPLFALAAMSLIAADYTAEAAKFRAEREKSLIAEDGWTTVVGLAWLKEGDNRAGSDPKAEVQLPASLPAQVGVFTLKSGHVHFQPASGVKLPARDLDPNLSSKDAVLSLGTVKFFLIQRTERFGVRIKDTQAATRKEFSHLSWYPLDPSWRITAQYVPWDKPHVLNFDTVISGLQ